MRDGPRERRRMTVTTERVADEVRVAVADSGPGVSEADREKIFEPFHSTKRDGMGMGLPIARSIVELHGGRLSCENKQDGATFFFTLPLDDPSANRSVAR
jgi:signal transduction histidine kinase